MRMTLEAAQMIVAHNGNGGLIGAINRCQSTVDRRADEGKPSPRFNRLLVELRSLFLSGASHASIMTAARKQTGEIA
jgi:hypothetical protein